jgi:comK protein
MDRISGKTLIIYYDNFNTVMINTDGKIIINGNFIRSILNKSCIFYGSSLNGRLKGSKDLLKCRYKLPIIISESNRLIFFPVNKYFWINFNMIESFEKKENHTIITFKNGYKRSIFVSYRVVNNQMLKCSRLWLEYLERK